MLLYKTQPKGIETNNIINLDTKTKLMETFGQISVFNNKNVKRQDFVPLITDASIIDGMIVSGGYSNILVVTSFEDANYERLRDRNYRPVNSAGDHLLPIVHTVNESEGNIYVTMPKNGDNYMKPLYDHYEVNQIECDSYFRLDHDFKIETDVKFDCIVLLGVEADKKGTYQIDDIKKKFAPYCIQPNVDLIDIRRMSETKINGGTRDIELYKDRMYTCVNTPKKLIDLEKRVVESEAYMLSLKQKLGYYRVALNIEEINDYYKVY